MDTVEGSLFSKNNRQELWDAIKGKEPEGRLKDLLPTEKLKKNFQETIKNHLKGTFKERTLSRDEIYHILVRKLLELTNPNSEYDVLFFQKVKDEKSKENYFDFFENVVQYIQYIFNRYNLI